MAAHVYWRINIQYAAGSTTNTAIAELSMHTSVGGGQAATGGTASADTSFSGDGAANAFDGNTSTFWASASAPTGKLQYQFASAVSIVEYAITARNDSFWNQAPARWTFEYSDDGSTWTVADNTYVSPATWSQGATQTFEVGANSGVLNGASVGKKLNEPQYAFEKGANGPNIVQVGKAPTPGPKTVSGTVTVNGTVAAGLIVCAHAKVTKELLGTGVTASDGSYSIKCGNNFTDVYVVAFDPTTYQAVVYDQVVPG